MKKFILGVLTALIFTIAITGCSPNTDNGGSNNAEEGYQTTSPEGVKLLLDKGKNIFIIDTRDSDKYTSAHIPGALNMTLEDIEENSEELLFNFDSIIIVYSDNAEDSKKASIKLIKLGYIDVRDMGEFKKWTYVTVSGNDAGTWGETDTDNPSESPSDKPSEPDVTPPDDDVEVEEINGILSSFYAPILSGGRADESIFASYEITMINVWATFCGPCINEMPELGEISREYKDKGVQIIGVVTDVTVDGQNFYASQLAAAKEIVSKTNANYTHLLPSGALKDVTDQFEYVPTTIFVDKYGRQVGETYIGAKSGDAWRSIIEATLAEVK